MSSIVIVSIIFVLLIALVGYAFVYQTLEKRRKRRQRLLTALKHRERSFKYMVSGFPPGFLTRDLTLIVYRALLDACEQLSRLEPRDRSHLEDFTYYSNELEALKQQDHPKRGRLENPGQVGELKQLLQDLYRFIALQAERGNLGASQGEAYKEQIKRLAVQMSVDAHAINARQAQAAGKPKLALHFYTLARKQLLRENGGKGYEKQLGQISGVIAKLEEQLAQAPDTSQTAAGPAPEEEKEWEHFNEEAAGWKKKQLYD